MSKPKTELQREISQMSTEEIARLKMLADEVMSIKNNNLPRIGYNEDAMQFALNVIAIKYNIPFGDREKEFALIGSILGSRPKKRRAVKKITKFTILYPGLDIVKFNSPLGITFEFLRKSEYMPTLLSSMGTHHASLSEISAAYDFAQDYFQKNSTSEV